MAEMTDAGRVFSGPGSKGLWKAINKVGRKRRKGIARAARDALYLLGCRCQELEAVVAGSRKKIG